MQSEARSCRMDGLRCFTTPYAPAAFVRALRPWRRYLEISRLDYPQLRFDGFAVRLNSPYSQLITPISLYNVFVNVEAGLRTIFGCLYACTHYTIRTSVQVFVWVPSFACSCAVHQPLFHEGAKCLALDRVCAFYMFDNFRFRLFPAASRYSTIAFLIS